MIGFSAAWDTLAIGTRVRVSNGQMDPGGEGVAHYAWRSHNFEGEIIEKIDGPPRAIKVQMDPLEGAIVAYEVSEPSGDEFEAI